MSPVSSPTRLAAQPPDLRRQNLSAILRTLLAGGPAARSELSRATGLAPGTVTRLTAELIAARMIHEQPTVVQTRQPGRPRLPVALDPRSLRAAGVHIGVLRTTIGLVDLAGGIVTERVLKHRSRKPDSIIRQAVTGLRTLVDAQPPGSVLGVGASLSGPVDPATGVVPEHTSLGWHDVPLRDELAAGVQLPVVLDSTMRALPLAETWFNGQESSPTMLHVFVGNVVGAALLVNGTPVLGAGSAAGYLDHLPTRVRTKRRCECGRDDCLLASAGDVVVVEEARARGILTAGEDLEELHDLAAGGDAAADRLLRRRAELVGAAVALLVEVLDPDVVVLGGGVVKGSRYLPDIRRAMADHVRRPLTTSPEDLVRATSFGAHAVMFSSAALFLDAFYRNPTGYGALSRS